MTQGRTSPIRAIGAAFISATLLAAGGCSSSTPARLVLSSGDVLQGSATTSVNGQFYVRNQKVNCTGTYEGRSVAGIGLTYGRKSAVTVRCSNGTTGSSDDPLYQTGQARLILSDGSKAQITIGQ